MKYVLGVLVFLIGAFAALVLTNACLDFKRQSYPQYITLRRGEGDE